MKLLARRKDGGGESTVTGYWLVEIKSLFSICLLRFDGASREAFHTHAFNCVSWVLKGELIEEFLDSDLFGGSAEAHRASWRPFVTRRTDFHKVSSVRGTTWVFSMRGPWRRQWREFRPAENRFVTLTHGRREVA